jgi:hypothetical protein
MKKNERLKAIVREWIENKLGFSMSDKLSIKMVAEIIEDQNQLTNNLSDVFSDTARINVSGYSENQMALAYNNGANAKRLGLYHFDINDYKEEPEKEPLGHTEILFNINGIKLPKEESEWMCILYDMPINGNVFKKSDPLICKLVNGQVVEGFTKNDIFRNDDGTTLDGVTHWKYKNQ